MFHGKIDYVKEFYELRLYSEFLLYILFKHSLFLGYTLSANENSYTLHGNGHGHTLYIFY